MCSLSGNCAKKKDLFVQQVIVTSFSNLQEDQEMTSGADAPSPRRFGLGPGERWSLKISGKDDDKAMVI